MELRLLGPVEFVVDGRSRPLGRRQERLLLAVLALTPGRLVPIERLVDLLWGEKPPSQARTAIYAAVSHLRAALRSATPHEVRLLTRGSGYALQIDPELVDLHQFRALAEGARSAASPQERIRRLTAALRLWRGAPLADIADDAQRVRLCPDLEDLHRTAREDLVAARLDAGEDEQLIEQITALVAEDPLRERPYGLWMRALYRTGRRAKALEVYRRARRRLVDDLGLEPGPELARLEQAILTDDPALIAPTGRPPAVIPAQLPARLAGFTGRDAQLRRLDALLAGVEDTPAVAVLAGTAGIGKTTLAVHWAHRVAARFPDGQLYVNLRGFHPTAAIMDPAEAVRGFLDALGVPAPRVPAGLDAQVGLYRSLLAGRRVLVVLDNARDAEQVRPLLPGAAGCLALVTSREELIGLAASHHAHILALDLLSGDEARELLGRRLGPDRVAAEPQAIERIVGRCARLPLALAITAARAAARPAFPLATLADELTGAGTGLDSLAVDDPTSNVRAVFSWSYRILTPPAARLFRLLSHSPGPDIDGPAAASLAGLPVERVRPLLAELTRGNLLTEQAPGRYASHDLLRDYAAELAATDDPAPDRQQAVRRVLDHYLHTARAAALLVEPLRVQIAMPPAAAGVVPEALADREQALAWFATHTVALLAAMTLAARSGLDSHVGPLAWTLTDYLQRVGQWEDQVAIHHAALEAADRLADETGQARAHRQLGRAYTLTGRFDRAEAHYRHALDLSGRQGDLNGQAQTHLSLSNVRGWQGRHDRAAEHSGQARELFRAAGDRSGEARALNAMGWSLGHLGEHRQALEHCELALRLLDELGDVLGEAYTRDTIGYVHHSLGDYPEAIACFRRAIEQFGQVGDRFQAANISINLGDALYQNGDPGAARDAWLRALATLDELGRPEADVARMRLDDTQGSAGRSGMRYTS